MSYFVPPEIVPAIVQHVLEDDIAPPGDYKTPGENSKPSWTLIEPLTLATRSFRQVSLEQWFRTLYIRSATDIEYLDELFPYLKNKWCKHLHCVQLHDYTAIRAWNLAGFRRLTSVRIDWLDLHFTPVVDSSLGAAEFKPFVNVECPVKAVEIRGLRYPSPMSLRAFTGPFLHMTTLELECLRIWCGLCHTCSLVRFPYPRPKGFLYEGGLGLPIHYARVLFSLDALQEVTITLPVLGHGLPSPGLSISVNHNFWAGECDGCMHLMYNDDAFTKSWVERKRGITSENVDERDIYVTPPNLKKVEWKFWEFDSGSPVYSREEVSNDGDVEIWAEEIV